VRAVLVLLHLLAIVVLALPNVRAGLDKSSWADPTVQDEFRAWAERFDVEPKELEASAWRLATAWDRLHQMLLTPFAPYRDVLGVRQPWVMFVAPQTHPARIEIGIFERGAWRTIYRERSPHEEWRRSLFDQDRMRSALFRFAWDKYGASYREFTEWAAREAFAEFPDADAVRVRMFRYRTPGPDEPRSPPGHYEKEILHRR
jgi:hypothetical protein